LAINKPSERDICTNFITPAIQQAGWDNGLSPSYTCLVSATNLAKNRIKVMFIRTAGQKTVNQNHISSLVILLMPLAEQHRIVAKVDELMALCNRLKTLIQQAIAVALVTQAVA